MGLGESRLKCKFIEMVVTHWQCIYICRRMTESHSLDRSIEQTRTSTSHMKQEEGLLEGKSGPN